MSEQRARPVCAEHGPMRYDPVTGMWICAGWAGEGCLTGMMVTDTQVSRRAELPGVWYEEMAS